jgi:hypothetical protein
MSKLKRKHWQEYPSHIDIDWMNSKVNGHGACFTWRNGRYDGWARITWIYGKSWYKLAWYNLILWCKYIKRKARVRRDG